MYIVAVLLCFCLLCFLLICVFLQVCTYLPLTMGNTVSREYPSTWNDSDVLEWKQKAKQVLTSYYLGFKGSVFHDWSDLSQDQRRAKICYALYGPPQENADSIESAYTDDQREGAGQVLNKIVEVWKQAPEPRFCVGIIIVCCKEETREYALPIFRLLWEQKKETIEIARFIDTTCRVYDSWADWKTNNTYPMMKYCYPLNGYFSCDEENYDFDVDKEPLFGFDTSPACNLGSRILRVFDVAATIGGFGAGFIGVAALFTPAGIIAAPLLLGSGIVGGTSATYGCAR